MSIREICRHITVDDIAAAIGMVLFCALVTAGVYFVGDQQVSVHLVITGKAVP